MGDRDRKEEKKRKLACLLQASSEDKIDKAITALCGESKDQASATEMPSKSAYSIAT